VVSDTISLILLAVMRRGRPQRGASFSIPAIPRSRNRLRQRRTVWRLMAKAWAISTCFAGGGLQHNLSSLDQAGRQGPTASEAFKVILLFSR
jgi:hypothetical protein